MNSKSKLLHLQALNGINFLVDDVSKVKVFRERLKDLLTIDRDIDNHLAEEQLILILRKLANFKETNTRNYREAARRAALDFYPKMSSFLTAKYNVQENTDIEIKFGKQDLQTYSLPTPKGLTHLLSELNSFFLEYYSRNQPTKSYTPISEELVYQNHLSIKRGSVSIDGTLMEKFYYQFHISLLNDIKKFPQFKAPQRKADFALSNDQGRFMVKLLHLIDFYSWKNNDYKYITPNFSKIPLKMRDESVRSLRTNLQDYLSRYQKSSFYTI